MDPVSLSLAPGWTTTAGPLLVVLLVTVAPTLMFLGLVRGLERMRDGLVRSGVVDRETERELAGRGVLETLASGREVFAGSEPSTRCPNCGGPELGGTGHCKECLAQVSRDA